jgi:hypothetical protein
MKKPLRRTPRHYDGTELTTHKIGDILPLILAEVGEVYSDRPDLILAPGQTSSAPSLPR